ncbi:hypothetical protein [Candidatus Mycoplasma haematominutum]|uniref:Uncharacterized protein n=1 Tax=Candidatus Mycoplasma haematominutum 'Birmingham 1' TaxID=1116213 RepID=G8C3P9_9MOLU|nr:hypothetical protein [Candidatus Mycoplasma haematominutum]CCE66947.1 hypothetical protein MHM_04290 [Candidatus Mycoplasma haematominutum 'Birmingham 1']
MFSLLRLCLGIVTVAGISTSVAVPVVLNSQGKNTVTTRVSTGGGRSRVSVKLEKCDTSSSSTTEVDFGAASGGEVCWKIEGEPQLSSSETSLTSLLQDNWNITSQDWNEAQDWKKECDSKWEVWSTGESEKQLGLCNSSQELAETPFVKKKHESPKTSISICASNCWEDSSSTSGSRKQLQSEQTSNWKPVKFFKKGGA